MFKKSFLACLFAVMAIQLAFSAQQKIYPVDSAEYAAISDMYLATGHALPSSTGPWSDAELRLMLEKLDRDGLPQALRNDYDWVLSRLDESFILQTEPIAIDVSLDATLELYAHTNTDGPEREDINGIREKAFVGRGNWAYDLVHADPLLQISAEIDVKDSLYLYFAMPLKQGFHAGAGWQYEIGSTNIGSNIPGLQTTDFNFCMDPNSPYRAFVSFGSAFWNLQIGRDRLNWGHGTTGNLVMSDNLPYHDMLRFSTFSRKFKFTFLVSSFRNKINYYVPSYRGSKTDDKEEIAGINLYVAHRIEGRFLNDRLAVTVTEAIMYASDTGTLDLRVLNPAYLLHNLYIASNSNSTIALEIDFTPINGLNLYVQAILDDFAIPGGEDVASADTFGYPNALGYLAGATYLLPLESSTLRFNIEGAYVDPYTYLRYKTDPSDTTESYGVDYVVPVRTYVSSSRMTDSVVYDEYFLGYRHGGDSIVANLNVEWRRSRVFTISGNAFFMAHGTHDMWTRWAKVGGSPSWNQSGVTPTTDHETGSYRYLDSEVAARDAVCFTLDVGAYGLYHISDSLMAFMQADLITVWNMYNSSGNAMCSDFQLVIGAKCSL
ncbi:MAG: hypothetical protein IJ863_07565 [Spirochaetales bacterium]|nr:hypothetical protein [Spirochaetales bacterium]